MPHTLKNKTPHILVASMMLGGMPAMAHANAAAPELSQTEVMSDLVNPWDIAFFDDGAMLVTEKCHGLSVRKPDGSVNKLLGMKDTEGYATTANDLFCQGQAGMNGVEIDPNFEENRFIYVYSASDKTPPATNRVLRLKLNKDFTKVSERTDIVADIPFKPKPTDHPFGEAGAHNGGRIQFGPDNTFLYVTTGDNHNSRIPQDPQSLGGKVLRIDRNGQAAPENGLSDDYDPRIFTYGHRNVQGLTFHPETGQPVVTEHGPWHSDEVNMLVAGGNSGWDPKPNMAGRGDCPDDYCGYMPNQKEGMDPDKRSEYMPITDINTYPDAINPAWQNNQLSQGISTAEFLNGEQWGQWEGRLAVGFMGIGFGGTPVGNRINLLDIADDGQSVNDVSEMVLPKESGRFRAIDQGPDGDLYAVMGEGVIHRISPE
ncbi:PQQ-dependent sugar dehydrogenase [uncultured Methylophaga sp.]|uniref:PQQ-dependent sugar dehydrogenase n=1 Tax=uncultured Methylophaga sp. TaxID=285271 RepID=UPI00262D8574|nr:PQQ-dependent sugar dehydrogenase [uncultured Methylophaga sp.]